MPGSILSVCDLGAGGISEVLDRADELRNCRGRVAVDGCVGLVFFEASLRTRTGFASAAARLGVSVFEVLEPRSGPTSVPEALADTLRVVSAYADALVVRADRALQPGAWATLGVPLLNAGDRSSDAEHPSQALIDLFAMKVMLGGHRRRHVVIWGDPKMRAARSLLMALAVTGGAERVSVVSDEEFLTGFMPPADLNIEIRSQRQQLDDDVDVLYVTGMAHESIALPRRDDLIVTTEVLARCPAASIVLSPMPVIDEISAAARQDPRVRFFEQSDLALWVRMAVLERLLSPPMR